VTGGSALRVLLEERLVIVDRSDAVAGLSCRCGGGVACFSGGALLEHTLDGLV